MADSVSKSQQLLNDVGLLVLRVAAGAMMFYGHGLPKWGRLTSGNEITFLDPFGIGPTASLILATGAEALGAALIVLGLLTRLSSIPLIITMIVAVFVAHADDPFGQRELGLFYLAAYVTLLLTGPGRLSLSELYAKRVSSPAVRWLSR